jgi:AcrR family transcriptional regulator
MARQTRQRILDASLMMFNAQGEPNVTTNHIADELEISPGNLYYHFRNKDDIIEQLFAVYEQRMDTALVAPSGRLPGLEDVWLQLHLVFECIWDYRFLYRDLVDILSRNRRLRMRFARILKRADEQAHTVMRGLVQAGVMRASADEVDAASTNILVIATFWMNYASARGDKDERASIRDGIVQVMMLIAPFLRDAERVHLNTLRRSASARLTALRASAMAVFGLRSGALGGGLRFAAGSDQQAERGQPDMPQVGFDVGRLLGLARGVLADRGHVGPPWGLAMTTHWRLRVEQSH